MNLASLGIVGSIWSINNVKLHPPVATSTRRAVALLGREDGCHTGAPVLTVGVWITWVTHSTWESRPAWAGVGVSIRWLYNAVTVHTVVRWTLVLLTSSSVVTCRSNRKMFQVATYTADNFYWCKLIMIMPSLKASMVAGRRLCHDFSQFNLTAAVQEGK